MIILARRRRCSVHARALFGAERHDEIKRWEQRVQVQVHDTMEEEEEIEEEEEVVVVVHQRHRQ